MSRAPGLRLGVDVGGTKVLVVAVDEAGMVVASDLHASPAQQPADGGRALAEVVADGLRQIAGALALDLESTPIGVGLPGMVTRSGTLAFAPNLRQADGATLADLLRPRLGELSLRVANDADCAAVAEHALGAGRSSRAMLMITLGTGIGGGLVIDGELCRGSQGFAGEIGHMVLAAGGPACPCGGQGCWERLCSGSALERLAREALVVGELGGALAERARAGGPLSGRDVTAAASEGDPEASKLVEDMGWWLGRGIANLTCVLDPDVVVVGGGLVHGAPQLVDAARRELPAMLEGGATRQPPRLVAAELGEQAGAIGASLLAGRLA